MEMNENITVEKDKLTGDVLLSGHDSDNIRELDNNLPKWWVWLFIITIIFGAGYLLVFDVFRLAPHQQQEWKNEMAAAGLAVPVQPDNVPSENLVPLTDRAGLDAGREVWLKNCKVCHLDGGQGLVGPNLTDDFSIHGCTYKDVVNIIIVGVPEKGMISWKAQLSGDQIRQVASFVMTLKGTNPPNPKAPQGEPCK